MRIHSTAVFAILPLLVSAAVWSADFDTGQEAYNSGDYQTALTEWQALAEEGHANAQFGMGTLYANGFGVPFDNEQARNWYQLAAEQGHAEAQCNLGVMHANGWGVPLSDEAAFEWYSLAAEQGVIRAQISLAKMYSRSFGATQDKVQGYKWYTVAMELGDSGARFKRDSLRKKMSADEIAESDHLASEWMVGHQNLLASH